jgi:hypothetical protein
LPPSPNSVNRNHNTNRRHNNSNESSGSNQNIESFGHNQNTDQSHSRRHVMTRLATIHRPALFTTPRL